MMLENKFNTSIETIYDVLKIEIINRNLSYQTLETRHYKQHVIL